MRTQAPPPRAAWASAISLWFGAPARWLDRARGPARLALMSAYATASSAMACAVWWATCLVGLPDVGDPFDVRSFRAGSVAREDNAFAPYAEAVALMAPPPLHSGAIQPDAGPDATALAVLAANRAALERFRAGAERPDAEVDRLGVDPAVPEAPPDVSSLVILSRVEARRLLEAGDAAGAWEWLRAGLRASSHRARRGTLDDRRIADAMRWMIRPGISAWAADPRTDALHLAKALADVLECDALAPVEADTVRAEYLLALGRLEEAAEPAGPAWLASPMRALDRESEQARRILKLAFANWLAHAEAPPDRRPMPAARSVLYHPSQNWSYEFFEPGPDAPEAAAALDPQRLGRWYEANSLARECAADWSVFRFVRGRESDDRELLLNLLVDQIATRTAWP